MIAINLNEDFKAILKELIKELSNKLKELNYEHQIEDSEDLSKLCLFYLNLRRRLVSPMPRNIVKSKEFKCPADLEVNLMKLENKIKNGEDLTPFLSRQLKKIDFADAMLNAWGVHHLHLGGYKGPNQFSSGLNEVVFAMFDDNNAYFIQIMTHKDWSNQEIISIVHNNWPDLIKNFKYIGSPINKMSDNDQKKWRNAGVNTTVTLDDGTTYFNPGGGIVLTKYSILDRNWCNIIIKKLYESENTIKEMEEIIKEKIQELYNLNLESFEFYLEKVELQQRYIDIKIREKNSGLGIRFINDIIVFYKL